MSPATPTIPPTPPRLMASRWREPRALAPQPKDRRPSTATPSWWRPEMVSQDWEIWTVARVLQGEILWLCRIFFGELHHIFCLSGCEEHPDHDDHHEKSWRLECFATLDSCEAFLFQCFRFYFSCKSKTKKVHSEFSAGVSLLLITGRCIIL